MQSRAVLVLIFVAGCGEPSGMTGQPCGNAEQCAGGLCLAFAGGYCSSDCTDTPCSGSDRCKIVAGKPVCLTICESPEECRNGYQCLRGTCAPLCTNDSDCGTGLSCQGGSCQSLSGVPLGSSCATDADCASRRCDPNSKSCRLACASDADCSHGTCWVNPTDVNSDNLTDGIAPICIPHRSGQALGASCQDDSECDVGQCELGRCVTLCEVSGQCASGQACTGMFAEIDEGAPAIQGCLPRVGRVTMNFGLGTNHRMALPMTARGFDVFVRTDDQTLLLHTGVTSMTDPGGKKILDPKLTFFSQPIRYGTSEGTSLMLVSNAPAEVQLLPGVYQFHTAADGGGYSTSARIKLAPSPPMSGHIPLHIFITDLKGGCKSFDASNAHDQLQGFETKLRGIFTQVGLDIGPITYSDTSVPNFVKGARSGSSHELDQLLLTATQGDAPDMLEIVVVKQILSPDDTGLDILGEAGGIPCSAGIPGTVHSGIALALNSLCNAGQDAFALTAAHEIGHCLGLFHNIEQSGQTDAITDNDNDKKKNLMFWKEDSPIGRLSPEQGAVLLSNPVVQ